MPCLRKNSAKSCCKSVTKKCLFTVKSFLQNTTFQGYHYLADPNLHWTERLFWIACIATISSYGVILMLRSLIDYRSNPINLTVDTNYIDWKSDYPALVFCERAEEDANYAGIDKFVPAKTKMSQAELSTYAKDLLFYNGVVNELRRCTDVAYLVEEPEHEESRFEWERLKEACGLFKDNLGDLKKFRRSCDDLFSMCSFNNKEFRCCEKFLPMQTILGECYAWNSMVAMNSTKAEYTASADDTGHMKVYLKQPIDTYNIFAISREENLSYRESLKRTPYNGRYYFKTGNVYIKFKNMANQKGVKNIPIDIRHCRFPEENELKMSKFYSFPSCMTEALAEKQMKTCGCTQYYLPEGADATKFCTTLEHVLCLSEKQADLLGDLRDHTCMISCEESDVTILGASSVDSFAHGDTPGDYQAVINFYFSAVRMRYHRKVIRDTIDMIVNVGGIGTLFFGASLISIIELLYYFFIFPCFSGQQAQQEDQTQQTQNKSQQFKQPQPQKAIDDLVAYIDFKQRIFATLKFQKKKILPYRN